MVRHNGGYGKLLCTNIKATDNPTQRLNEVKHLVITAGVMTQERTISGAGSGMAGMAAAIPI